MNNNAYDDEENGEADQAAKEADLLNKVRSIKTILISAHCADRSNFIAKDANGRFLLDTDPDYVKAGLGFGKGDYVEIEVNIETGQVVGWKKPTEDDMMDAFGGKD
jgi:hypothetical protein